MNKFEDSHRIALVIKEELKEMKTFMAGKWNEIWGNHSNVALKLNWRIIKNNEKVYLWKEKNKFKKIWVEIKKI